MEEYKWILIGSIFLITGIVLYLTTSGLRKMGVKTKARAKNHKLENDGEDSSIHEVFEFEDKNVKIHNSKSLVGSSFGLYVKGQVVEIIYDENNPEKVIPNKSYLLHIYIIPIILGLIFITAQFLLL